MQNNTNFAAMTTLISFEKYFQHLIFTFFLLSSLNGTAQSPKKYLKNGFYEQAYLESVKKQNKKVKIKKKFSVVIYESYEQIYKKNHAVIISSDSDWEKSFNAFIRVANFRLKMKHPGVLNKLKDIYDDKELIVLLAGKFNETNFQAINEAASHESIGKFDKAIELYQAIAKRTKQVKPISVLYDKLIIIDTEKKIVQANQKIGDQHISEARKLLESGMKKDAEQAVIQIKKASLYRPLDAEEEELLVLANLIIGDAWMSEAEKLLQTRTKRNARMAYDLINKARTVRNLSVAEEQLLNSAHQLGMTRVLVKVNGKSSLHSAQYLSGILNKKKSSSWLTYYYERNNNSPIDFELIIEEKDLTVILGDIRKEVKQNSKTVEYWEEELDANGNKVKVKKSKVVVAMVAILSRTKTANIPWSITLKDLGDGQHVYSETKETIVEITHQSASLVSGDVRALPENISTDINLDTHPFPSDKEMTKQVKDKYLKELNDLIVSKKDHLLNLNKVID